MKNLDLTETEEFILKYPYSFWDRNVKNFIKSKLERSKDLIKFYTQKNTSMKIDGVEYRERMNKSLNVVKKLEEWDKYDQSLLTIPIKNVREWFIVDDLEQIKRIGIKLFIIINYEKMYETRN